MGRKTSSFVFNDAVLGSLLTGHHCGSSSMYVGCFWEVKISLPFMVCKRGGCMQVGVCLCCTKGMSELWAGVHVSRTKACKGCVGCCASAAPRQGRESMAEREWTACEMQASIPTNSWRMFQQGVSWVHKGFNRGYISLGESDFHMYERGCTSGVSYWIRDSGLGIKLLSGYSCTCIFLML
ncbi:unnamed protein product [Prunus armeniaca]